MELKISTQQLFMLSFLFVFILHIDLITATVQCIRRSPCRCVFEDTGDGYDLGGLDYKEYFASPPMANNLTYYFHPCRDITVTPSIENVTINCKHYSLCVYNRTSQTVETIGKANESVFRLDETVDLNVFIVLTHNSITSNIELICTPNKHETKLFGGDDNHLTLYSPFACRTHLEDVSTLSTGAVLIIILLLVILVYGVLGVTVNFFLIGARGIEIVPHLSFWKDLPSLIMDGAKFVQNGFKAAPSDLVRNQDSYTSI